MSVWMVGFANVCDPFSLGLAKSMNSPITNFSKLLVTKREKTCLVNLFPFVFQLFIWYICLNGVGASIAQTVFLFGFGGDRGTLDFCTVSVQRHHRGLEGNGLVDRRGSLRLIGSYYSLCFSCCRGAVCVPFLAGRRGLFCLLEEFGSEFLGKFGSPAHAAERPRRDR